MHGEPALADTAKLHLPADLLQELQRRGPARTTDFKVEGWKPSFFGRIREMFVGGSRRGKRSS